MELIIAVIAVYYLGRIRQWQLNRRDNPVGHHLGEAYKAIRDHEQRDGKGGER
ncbi:hypothetical protein [Streptomyces sp. PR69]|uniref:hypothetical protein n=1 Tax=Streptomyces sp. PR69 TaxID=2984950 RepID=UPI002264AC38|nr:hypothetical protein [Streptomyces sp. PR69]